MTTATTAKAARLNGHTVLLRLFAFIFLILASQPASAQIEIPESKRGKPPVTISFYDRCMNFVDSAFKKETQEASCACMAAQMAAVVQKKKDEESYNSYHKEEKTEIEAKIEDDVLFRDVYGPCLYITARDMAYDECYYNKKFHPHMDSKEQLVNMCNCMAGFEEEYFQKYAQPRLAAIIASKGIENVTDPMDAILNDFDYLSTHNKIRAGCFNRFTRDYTKQKQFQQQQQQQQQR